ncbi:unnamed protein product [Agarophyton chilense]
MADSREPSPSPVWCSAVFRGTSTLRFPALCLSFFKRTTATRISVSSPQRLASAGSICLHINETWISLRIRLASCLSLHLNCTADFFPTRIANAKTLMLLSQFRSMVRYLKNWIDVITDQQTLNRFVAVEILLARLHFPVSICFAVGVLAQTGLVPYVAPYEWRLVLIASLFLTITNGRDLHYCIRHFYQSQASEQDTLGSVEIVARKHAPDAGGQMQMLGAFALTLGSVSLLNASIIALIRDNPVSYVVSRRQYAASFALFLVGSGANSVLSGDKAQSLESFRVLICFQNLLAAATLCTASVLLLPEIGVEEKMNHFQTSLLTALSCIGSVMLVMSSLVNYFHAVGYCSLHCEGYNLFVEQRRSQVGKRSDSMVTWEKVKGLLWSRKNAWWRRRKSHRKCVQRAVRSSSLEHSTEEEFQKDAESDDLESNYSSPLTSEFSSSRSLSTVYDEETGSRSSFASEESENEQPTKERHRKSKRDRYLPCAVES